jgi:hypothetical protein
MFSQNNHLIKKIIKIFYILIQFFIISRINIYILQQFLLILISKNLFLIKVERLL